MRHIDRLPGSIWYRVAQYTDSHPDLTTEVRELLESIEEQALTFGGEFSHLLRRTGIDTKGYEELTREILEEGRDRPRS